MFYWIEEYDPEVLHHLQDDEERPPRAAWTLFLSGTRVAHAAVDQESNFYAITAGSRPTMVTEIADACGELLLFVDAADWSADSVPDQLLVSPAMARRLMDAKETLRCPEMGAVAVKPTTSPSINLEGLAAAIATLNGHLARDDFGNVGQGTTPGRQGERQAREASGLTDAVVVDVEEAAKMLRISRASITRMIGNGSLPSMLIQGRRLISKDVLHEMVSKGSIPKG